MPREAKRDPNRLSDEELPTSPLHRAWWRRAARIPSQPLSAGDAFLRASQSCASLRKFGDIGLLPQGPHPMGIHPKKSRGLLREGIDVKFGFIARHRGDRPPPSGPMAMLV
jgi:hypothetical protein